MIDCVALDMIGVLVQEEKLISGGMKEFVGGELLVPLDVVKQRYDEGFVTGALTREEFWTGLLHGDWRSRERAFLEHRAVAPDAKRTCEVLHETGRLVGVISDMPRDWAVEILEMHGILSLVDAAVFSSDGLGSKKDGRLFRALEAATGIAPERTLLVDDRLKNLDSARTLGFKTAWLPLDARGDGASSTHAHLSSLAELPALVNALA